MTDPYDAYPDISGRPDQVVGSTFRLDIVISRGAMGTVWKATDLRSGREVAVKMMSRLHLASAEARRRFRREVRAVSQIRSRFALGIYASGETRDGVPYMVMDYLQGETLEDKLERVGRLALTDSVRIAVQIARALSRAHDAGFIHRDLKPANIFLIQDPRTFKLVAKVLDFGVAKFMQEQRAELMESSAPTKTGVLLGTPEFMSPEQAQGSKYVDFRSDIYSLGLLVFNMVTGESAIAEKRYAEIIVALARGKVRSMREVSTDLPLALDTWFLRACAYDPAARFQTADELAIELHKAASLSGPLTQHLDYNPPDLEEPLPRPVARESIVDFMAGDDKLNITLGGRQTSGAKEAGYGIAETARSVPADVPAKSPKRRVARRKTGDRFGVPQLAFIAALLLAIVAVVVAWLR